MRIADTSPWFRRSLYRDYPPDALRALEPRAATLSGITDKRNAFHTARMTVGKVEYAGTARTAGEALRKAIRLYHEAEGVDIVSYLSGPAA